jgi:dienelactone hydrolase
MAELILFHHAQGLTDGVRAFADELRAAGHRVTVPDLYEDGATFATVEEGVAHAEQIGRDEITARALRAAADLPAAIVYAGFSLGVPRAQKLAQTRPGALGALLYHDAIPASYFSETWPGDVALQIHVSEHDAWADLDAARALMKDAPDAKLYVYPGSAHLFADSSLAEYDEEAARLVLDRSKEFLARRTRGA